MTTAAPHPMRRPPACHRLLRTVPPLVPRHALNLLSHPRNWMMASGACYTPGQVVEQLTASTPRVHQAPPRASAQMDQLTDEVLDLALEPLRVLYPQAHISPAATSNRLARLCLQHRVEACHVGGILGQWLTLRNPSTAQGQWYLHQLFFLPQAAPKHHRQDPYDTHPERLGAQSFPRPAPPALPQEQGQGALLQGPPLAATTAVQQRGRRDADGAEWDHNICGLVACTAASRHLARETTGVRPHQPADRTGLASPVVAVTMGPVTAWPARLLPLVSCHGARPRQRATKHAPTATLTAKQLYAVAPALLEASGGSLSTSTS